MLTLLEILSTHCLSYTPKITLMVVHLRRHSIQHVYSLQQGSGVAVAKGKDDETRKVDLHCCLVQLQPWLHQLIYHNEETPT